MNRRGFLGILAAATLDPERLLWMPGKLISIPAPAKPGPARGEHYIFAGRVGWPGSESLLPWVLVPEYGGTTAGPWRVYGPQRP